MSAHATPAIPHGPAAVPATPICELRDVSIGFTRPDGTKSEVLHGISLDLRANEVVGILGPSGGGKSTLLRIIAGLLPPDRGEVLLHGKPLIGNNPGTAIVFQTPALYPWMSVRRNIEMVLESRGFDEAMVHARTEFALKVVGLEGFEDAYPRELSGGMKQRVGVARALSVDPEILILDSPFSQLDGLTAENLRQELLDIWFDAERNPSSVLVVSHDIREVVAMADRIVILSGTPSHILTVLDNPLPRPRDPRASAFLRMVDQVHTLITRGELPDAPVAAVRTAGPPPIAPIPRAAITKVLGLLEMIEAKGGRQDIYDLCAELNYEFGDFLEVVKGAELLGLVLTPGGDVEHTALGVRLLQAKIGERKLIVKEQLMKIGLFVHIVSLLSGMENRSASKELLVDEIVLRLPNQRPAGTFDTLINWGRYAELLGYNRDEDRVYLDQI